MQRWRQSCSSMLLSVLKIRCLQYPNIKANRIKSWMICDTICGFIFLFIYLGNYFIYLHTAHTHSSFVGMRIQCPQVHLWISSLKERPIIKTPFLLWCIYQSIRFTVRFWTLRTWRVITTRVNWLITVGSYFCYFIVTWALCWNSIALSLELSVEAASDETSSDS